ATDLRGRIVDANPALGRLLGTSAADLIGRDLADMERSDDGDVATDLRYAIDELAAGRRATVRHEGRLVRPDGHEIWVTMTISAVRDDYGRVRRLSFMLDETIQSRAGWQARGTSEERLRALVAACPAGIVEVDTDRRVRTWNAAAERIFGWRAEEVLGRILPFRGPDAEADRARWDALLSGEAL